MNNFLENKNNIPLRVAIQGYAGSFHSMAAQKYWEGRELDLVPADSFDILGNMLASGDVDWALMAIENSIAGTLLQNYRILREQNLWVVGEVYLRINHHLLGIEGTSIDQIKTISSHPMAIFQCLAFLSNHPDIKIIESEDTALSAKHIADNPKRTKACIASRQAAELYGLKILCPDIETNKQNYTRFFVLSRQNHLYDSNANKASIYIKIPDQKGMLLKVLAAIHSHDINLSKLQSFPVMGSFREYFFHMDLEFESVTQFNRLLDKLQGLTLELTICGIYHQADISEIVQSNAQSNLI
jgi:prephenate dehydratase